MKSRATPAARVESAALGVNALTALGLTVALVAGGHGGYFAPDFGGFHPIPVLGFVVGLAVAATSALRHAGFVVWELEEELPRCLSRSHDRNELGDDLPEARDLDGLASGDLVEEVREAPPQLRDVGSAHGSPSGCTWSGVRVA